VFARALVRHHEILRSTELIARTLAKVPRGDLQRAVGSLTPNSIVVSLIEGHRGEVCHVATTGDDGRIAHYDVIDPSFHNWTGLALALVDQQISDFPLCNKSFDLSYCGFDL
jgi:Ni,Fe-hydrogenase III large subunit